jgi:hypothetical protein
MTNEEFNRRIDRLTERQQALAETAELTQASLNDLSAVVRNMVERDRMKAERSARYLSMLSDVLKAWSADSAEDGGVNGEKN